MSWLRILAVSVGILMAANSSANSKLPAENPVQEAEQAMQRLIRAQGEHPVGDIRADAESGILGSYQGMVEVGTRTRRRVDLADMDFGNGLDDGGLYGHLMRLLEASASSPQGRWFYVIVSAHEDGTIEFQYFREREQLESIAQLKLEKHALIPGYVFIQRFDPGLVAELSNFEVSTGIAGHVPARLAAGKPVSPELLELFATIDWELDVNNGGMDQYFAREHSDFTGMPRDAYYPLVLAGLKRIGATEEAAIFAESIALWAHFHPRVEAARKAMGIDAVPRQEQSDIGGRYYLYSDDLDRLRAEYIRAHPGILEARPARD